MALCQRLVHCRDNLRVIENAIGPPHPGFVQVANLGRDQPVAKAALRPPRFDHARLRRGLGVSRSGRNSA